MRWRRIAPVLVLGLGLASPAKADLVERVPLEPSGALRVELDRGNVEVLSHPDADVRVEARARGVGASSIRFVLATRDGELVLSGSAEPWVAWMRSGPRVAVRIWVPRPCPIEIHTAGGDVVVDGVTGGVVAHTSGGSIRVRDVDGPVDARTSGGSIATRSVHGDVSAETAGGRIDVVAVDGDVRAVTSGGRITLTRVSGDAEAHTSGGPIEIDGVAGRVVAQTSGGAVLTRFTAAPAGSVETSGGTIEVAFPAGAGADLDALSHGGSVHVEHATHAVHRVGPGHHTGRINGGGDTLRLRASGGSIHVRAP